jgi:hypothetical protein
MKKLIYFAPILLLAGCTPEQVGQAFDVAQMGVDAAGTAAMVPSPASPWLGIASIAGNAILGVAGYALKKKHDSKKVENNAHYQGVNKVAEKVEMFAWQLKRDDVDPKAIGDALEGLVKSTMEEVHSAYGVYEQVEKHIHQLRKNKEMSRIDG